MNNVDKKLDEIGWTIFLNKKLTFLPSTDDILAASKVTGGGIILTLKNQNPFKCQKSK